MKTKLVLRLLNCLLSIFLILLAGCGPAAAPALPPTQPAATAAPAATATTLAVVPPAQAAGPAPLDTFLAALDALNASPGFTYTTQHISLTRQKLIMPDQPVMESSNLVSTTDTGARLLADGKPNISVKRKINFLGASSSPNLQVEMRLVDDQAYARAAYAQQAPGLSPLPDGWMPLYGDTTLAYWPVLNDPSLRSIPAELKGDAWSLVSGVTAEHYRQTLAGSLASISQAGAPDRVITAVLKADALRGLSRWVDFDSPINNRILAAIQGAPLTLQLTVDSAGRPLALTSKVVASVEALDIGGLERTPAGSALTVYVEVTDQITLRAGDQPQAVSAPGPAEMGAFPAYSGADPRFPFKTLGEFDRFLSQAASSGQMAGFWKALDGVRMPLIFGDTVLFFYHGQAGAVSWPGNWNDRAASDGRRLGDAQTWWTVLHLPLDARLEYQVQVDGQPPVTDPRNPLGETGGLGTQSVVMMPGYTPPDYINPRPGTARGSLTGDLTIQSQSLGYPVHYRVYTPAGYEAMRGLPVLYITDGQDFLQFGKLDTALDNLIADGTMRPVIGVFIDPRDITTGENLREKQFLENPKYAGFIANELVPAVDRAYRTDPSAGARGILGASYGGYFGAYLALHHPGAFNQVGILSPVIGYNPALLDAYRKAERLPLKFFIGTGTWSDVNYHAALFKDALREKGYPVQYRESNEGHSYGTWRGNLGPLLAFLFPKEK